MVTARRTAPVYRQRSVPVVPSGNAQIDKAIESVRKLVDDSETAPIVKGRMVEKVDVRPMTDPERPYTYVVHKLGRKPVGWIVVDVFGAELPQLYCMERTDKHLKLKHVGAVTTVFSLWVF